MNHDFFGGSDLSIRYPPFVQAINAWIIDLFDSSALRIFPIYFVILASLSIYLITRNLNRDNFHSMTAVCITLMTPALLVISSRFSLQQDLPFIAFVSASVYMFLRVVRSNEIGKIDFTFFVISLSILPLVREIGLILSWFLFFYFLTLRYSKDHVSLRICFSILSLLPLYALTLNDIRNVGLTPILFIRIVTLIIGNVIVYLLKLKSIQSKKISLFSNYLPLLVLFAVPASFIISNVILMKGPYPTLMFSPEFNIALNDYRYIFEIENKLYQSVYDSLLQIPRIDLLFFSIALGSIFFLFKFKGILNLIKDIRIGKDFPNILFAYLVITSVIWSYLLSSGFTEASIRHIAYFVPLFSIIITLALNGKSVSHRVYIFAMIIFSLYYYLHHDVAITNQNGHFYAIWIDPKISPYISYFGLIFGIILFCGYLSIDFVRSRISKYNLSSNFKYVTFLFPFLLTLGCYFLISANIQISTPLTDYMSLDKSWENDVFEVTNYLNYADEGNVLSVRTPAISYFTNRTNYDVFNPHIFGRVILPIINSSDVITLEKKLIDLGIEYIIIPNSKNPSHTIVENIEDRYRFQEKLQSSENFESIHLDHHVIYKLVDPSSTKYDLLDSNYRWKEYGANLLDSNSGLLILSEANSNQIQYNRIYLDTAIPLSTKPLLMTLNYSSGIEIGNALFVFEIRDSSTGEVLYSRYLENTQQADQLQYLLLHPKTTGKEIQMRFYIISNEPGKSYLELKVAKISNL